MNFNREAFFKSYRKAFGRLTQSQVSGIEDLLDFIEADEAWGDSVIDVQQVSYMLATIKHECADKWKPINEYASGAAYEGRRDLGNTKKGDGVRFKGRGYVQITGRTNYTTFSKITGANLVEFPETALSPPISYHIASEGMRRGLFTGKSLDDYINEDKTDFYQARRIINKLDKAKLIASYAVLFETILGDALTEGQEPLAAEANGNGYSSSPPALQPESQIPAPVQTVEQGATGVQLNQPTLPVVSSAFDEPVKIAKGKSTDLLNYLMSASGIGSIVAFYQQNPMLTIFFACIVVVAVLTVVIVVHLRKMKEAETKSDPTKYSIQFSNEVKAP
jgi:putative chitinase